MLMHGGTEHGYFIAVMFIVVIGIILLIFRGGTRRSLALNRPELFAEDTPCPTCGESLMHHTGTMLRACRINPQ